MKQRLGIKVRPYREKDIIDMAKIWNEIVRTGTAFPQLEELTETSSAKFFSIQSHCGVAIDASGILLGLYILHPNNVGRCGHICNASYAVTASARGRGIGEALVRDCISQARRLQFRILQFNAVVRTNTPARHLYEKLGFTPLGVIPGGFRLDNGTFEDIIPYFLVL